MTAALVGLYAFSLIRGGGELEARTMAFTGLVVSNVCVIISGFSWSRGIAWVFQKAGGVLSVLLIGVVSMLALIISIPAIREVFRMSALSSEQVAIAVAVGIGSVAWVGLLPRKDVEVGNEN
jgi:Ca2+-transporting ATPase